MPIQGSFKSYFVRGMAVLLPTILTIGVFVWGFRFIQGNISTHINRGLVRVIVVSFPNAIDVSQDEARGYLINQRPELQENKTLLAELEQKPSTLQKVRIQKLEKFWVHGLGQIMGFVLALLAVFSIGVFIASVVGRSLWHAFENFIMRTPILKSIYPYVKQITDFFFRGDGKKPFSDSKVVAVEYPRKGAWSMGLVTGTSFKILAEREGEKMVTVFVPTSPTPFTGFVVMVPRSQVIELDMTIEEAVRFTVSGGVISIEGESTQNFSDEQNA